MISVTVKVSDDMPEVFLDFLISHEIHTVLRMEVTMSTHDVINYIATVTAVADLDKIIQAAESRKRTIVLNTIQIGATVKFNDTIRPAYLVGLPVTVSGLVQGKVFVDCPADHKYGRFSGSKGVRVPLSLIEP